MIEDRVAAETDVVTKVSYYSPAALAASHHLTGELAASLARINALTDALGASQRPDPGTAKARA